MQKKEFIETYMMKAIPAFLFLMLCSGCSLLNKLYDDHQVFVEARNSEVGKEIDWVLKYSKHYYFYNEGNGVYSKKYITKKIDEEHTEYQFEGPSSCYWGLLVKEQSKVIESWRFISDRSACMYKKFYEGPF